MFQRDERKRDGLEECRVVVERRRRRGRDEIFPDEAGSEGGGEGRDLEGGVGEEEEGGGRFVGRERLVGGIVQGKGRTCEAFGIGVFCEVSGEEERGEAPLLQVELEGFLGEGAGGLGF